MFVITATAASGHSAADLLAAIDDVLRGAKLSPPSAYLFIGAVAGYVIDSVFALQTHAARAAQYAYCDERGLLSSCVGTWLRRYLQLSASDLSNAIVRQLPLDRRVVIEVIPSRDARNRWRAAGDSAVTRRGAGRPLGLLMLTCIGSCAAVRPRTSPPPRFFFGSSTANPDAFRISPRR